MAFFSIQRTKADEQMIPSTKSKATCAPPSLSYLLTYLDYSIFFVFVLAKVYLLEFVTFAREELNLQAR